MRTCLRMMAAPMANGNMTLKQITVSLKKRLQAFKNKFNMRRELNKVKK